ncbi:MAG: iron-sulfur cluster assembly accessory protein [Buchnera aphidicola (Chaetogeoica yunlongensis)]
MNEKNHFVLLLPSHNNKIKYTQGIKLTISAKKQLILLTKKNKKKIKIGIRKTGCAGFQYFMEEIKHPLNDLTTTMFFSKEISLVIENKNLNILDGIKIDFVKDGINKSFKFTHKKIKNFCGCGNSFEL